MSKSGWLVRRTGMSSKQGVIENVDIAARPSAVQAALVRMWGIKRDTAAWKFDIVGEHVTAKFHVAVTTPTFLGLVCTGESCDLGWVGTRAHVAIAATGSGARIAVVHGGVPADGATRDAWRQLFDELKAELEHDQIAA